MKKPFARGHAHIISTWFGSVEYEDRSVRISVVAAIKATSGGEDVVEMADVIENVVCTNLHVAILLKSGEIRVRRADDVGNVPKVVDLKKQGQKILVANDHEIYAVIGSEIYRIWVDAHGESRPKRAIRFPPRTARIVAADGGHEHTVYLDEHGNVYTMGTGTRGELGIGSNVYEAGTPALVDLLAGIRVTKVVCGGWHTTVLTADGDAYTWGWNRYGQCGSDKAPILHLPEPIDPQDDLGSESDRIDDVAASEYSTRFTVKPDEDGDETTEFVLGSDRVPINDFGEQE
ncbi:unnamed protein product [Caenorhabditis sp. 36 PRJEB53466]|nr:unnamed protein product [Caenorhabditis sp. 36 PRJEB53466]